MDLWKVDGKEHVIGLVELYASVVALKTWQELLKDQRLLLFIDNYGAQDCLVKGTAAVETWRQLLLVLEDVNNDFFSDLWVSRVASASNPADFPSRASVKEIEYLGPLQRCRPICPLVGYALEMIC